MKLAFVILISFSFSITLSASTSYLKPSPVKKNKPRDPVTKSLKSLKDLFFRLKGEGVTINEVSSDSGRFELSGSFSNKLMFNKFLEGIKGVDKVDRKLDVEIKKDSFPGSRYYDFKISGLNKWN